MLLWLLPLLVSQVPAMVSFSAADGLEVTADWYAPHGGRAPVIVLFHQARWSRGEYRETAPRLNVLGYDCLAVDQRSGGEVNGVENETAARAEEQGLATGYADAVPDLVAALESVRARRPESRVVAWGSSYSAALVLRVVGEHPELADAVVSFSPGEYFERKGWIAAAAAKIEAPVFITSAKGEGGAWRAIWEAIPEGHKRSFLPETAGSHGSRALWEKTAGSESTWRALEEFLGAEVPVARARAPARAGD